MKNTFRTFALFASVVALFASSQAQVVQASDPGTAFEWKQASDGSSLLAMNALPIAEHYFNLPFGLDFYAGHEFWLGTRTRISSPGDAEGVFGYELYARKNVGSVSGADFFVKAGAGLCVGPHTDRNKALTGYLSLSAGIRF